MLNSKVSGIDININSDSQAVLKALAKYTTSSKILQDCHNALQTITQSLRWMDGGHNRNLGNDTTDELARLATSLKVVGPEPIIPIPFREYKTWLHKKTQSSHSELWINGITDSPLCRACMEADETPTHVLLQCRGVEEQRAAYLGCPASLPEALGDLGGLLSFWSELGVLE
ncbi:jg27759 [Pararge aegeria aegeria]|uniref:Jg27759 protein n=1 Tax=Pararge aegeria aegeria TaxID=348720 RepID=A0A8S4QU21_9NEOP|nr:jg27759 [Pararge aegeria aegeria]